MADTEFITARFPDAEMPKTQTRAEARQRVHGFIRPEEKARIREAGGQFGPWLTEAGAVRRLDNRMARLGVGPKLIVQRANDNAQLSIREVRAGPLIPDLNAHPQIEKSHGLTYAKFNDLRSGGVWLCRFVDGSRTVSKHGYLDDTAPGWKGAAEDTFVTAGGMEHLEEVARFKVHLAKEGDLRLATVIVNRTIWTAPDFDPRPYGGVQHFHIHEDASGGHACSP